MKIYNLAGTVLLDIEVGDDSYSYREIMGRDDLTLYFALTSFVEIPVGAYCVFQNVAYYLLKPESLKLQHTRNWEYTLTMETYAGLLQTAIYQNPDDRRLKFFVTGPATTHLDLLVRCLNGKRSGWSSESTVDTSVEKTIGYDFCNCKEALQQMADGFETEWEITGKKIVLGKVEHGKATPVSMSYGKGNGFLPGVERRNYNDEIPLSRLFVQGGDRNIVFSSYGAKTLMMPKGVTVGYDGEKFSWESGYSPAKAKAFTTDSDGASVSLVGATSECDGALDCSEIYPRRVGTVSEVIVVDAAKNLYDFVDNTIPLPLDYAECATSETMTVIFQTGALAGREFDVAFTKRKADVVVNRFAIVPATIDEVDMPSASFAPVAGDKYIVFHCSLPQSYINDQDTHTGAEWEVLRKAVAYLWDSCQPRFSISGKMDGIWSKSRWDSIGGSIVPGGYISFTDERFSPEAFSVRITAVTQFVNRPYSPEITLSNEPTRGGVVSSIRDVKGDVVTTQGDVAGGMNYTRRRYRDVKETADVLDKYRGVTWSIVSGSDYASINQSTGEVTAKDGATSSVVVIRATSSYSAAIYAEKTVAVTYSAGPDISFSDDVGGVINVRASDTSVGNRFQFANIGQLEASVTGSLSGASASVNDDGETSGEVRVTFAANTSSSERRGTVTVTGTRTDGKGAYSKSYVIIQAAAAAAAAPTWSLPSSYTYDSDGSNYPDVLITDEGNVGWRLVLPDWIQTEGGITEGTGTFSLMMTAEGNDGSERTAELKLVSADGSVVYATCSITQEGA